MGLLWSGAVGRLGRTDKGPGMWGCAFLGPQVRAGQAEDCCLCSLGPQVRARAGRHAVPLSGRRGSVWVWRLGVGLRDVPLGMFLGPQVRAAGAWGLLFPGQSGGAHWGAKLVVAQCLFLGVVVTRTGCAVLQVISSCAIRMFCRCSGSALRDENSLKTHLRPATYVLHVHRSWRLSPAARRSLTGWSGSWRRAWPQPRQRRRPKQPQP